MQHIGKTAIQSEIVKIKSFIDPKYYTKIEKILNLLDTDTFSNASGVPSIVPPLVNDIPLSYRSNCEDDYTQPKPSPLLGQTASSIQGFVEKSSSYEPQVG